jgi:hypothetical protein
MKVFVEGISLLGPGLNGWMASRAVLTGASPYLNAAIDIPICDLLPSTERRRIGLPVKLALALGTEAIAHAQRNAADVLTVFASSSGDGDNMHHIFTTLASNGRDVSPTRFHNSVHNAPAGYWSIATKSGTASTSLSCHDTSFAAGLLEATAQALCIDSAVALIAYDVPYPPPLLAARSINAALGAAMVLSRHAGNHSFAALEINLISSKTSSTTNALLPPDLLGFNAPAARALPLLALLASSAAGKIELDYGPGQLLRIEVQPC